MRAGASAGAAPIDRHALVARHAVILTRADPLTPLSVGNGEFAFTADVTGLQTFPGFHAAGMQLNTMAQWGWHSAPNPEGFHPEEVLTAYALDGRQIALPDAAGRSARARAANAWLRANPHRLNLGRIGLRLRDRDGRVVRIEELAACTQRLDLWEGLMESRFAFGGEAVRVLTVGHPSRHLVTARVESPGVAAGRVSIRLGFPYGSTEWGQASDWGRPERHVTRAHPAAGGVRFERALDGERYEARAAWSAGAVFRPAARHEFEVAAPGREVLELVMAFSPQPDPEPLPSFAATRAAAAAHWGRFWSGGGVVDLSRSRDPRWRELERRVVLSQYLTAVHGAGSMPPQETGLVQNSWHGKSHLEMHWWHGAHFAFWDRIALLERSLPYYQRILPRAQQTARRQGYRGARWPKMTGPNGRESPSGVGVFLIWQQPHPVYYAELCHRAHGDRATLERHREVVFETAEFMASYPVWDEAGRRFVLGPVLIPAQENYDPRTTVNPTFELAYWRWGLETAQQWRVRLGMARDPGWDRVLRNLARPSIRDGVYTAVETPPYTKRQDHPSLLAALGVLPPTAGIDVAVMRRTLDDVVRHWDWPRTWGWDYPMLAMTAARVGRPEAAVAALLMDTPKNRYLANGHNFQRANLPLYLPGNGGLLAAVAMMAAGWDGAPARPAPGFPGDGSWTVRWEGLKPMP
ncbi:MAG: hypothetical protein JXQ71_06485 [Verrucomicrobia bacterium]|nr:hypothetical protein [Verrucomicrobiota bacterium]